MRKQIVVFGLIFLWAGSATAQRFASSQDQASIERDLATQGYAQIIVDLTPPEPRPGKSGEELARESAQAIDSFLSRNTFRSGDVVARLPLTPTFAVKVTSDEYAGLLQTPEVFRISYNGALHIRQDELTSLGNLPSGLRGLYGRNLQLLGVRDALYQQGVGGQSFVIAVIDTGLDPDHRAVSGRVIGGQCFSTNNGDYLPLCPGGTTEAPGIDATRPCEIRPTCDHGTADASLAAGFGVTPVLPGPYDAAKSDYFGVAPRAFLYPIMAMSQPQDGGAPRSTRFDLRQALQHVYQRRNDFGAKKFAAVNISLNAEDSLSAVACDNDPISFDVDRLRSVDIATVISAGNNGDKTQVAWPACISSAIVVASSNLNDEPSSFSNFSALVDFFAPGEGVNYALPDDEIGSTLGGTSFAAPQVAGAFAVVRSSSTNIRLPDVERILKANGQPVRVGSMQRPRIQVNQASAAARPGWLNPSWQIIAFNDQTRSAIIFWHVLRGSAVWEVASKPKWIDVSGLTGKAPDNPTLTIWLNAEAAQLPDGTRDILQIRNKTIAQPEIAISLIYTKTPSPPSLPFWLVKVNNWGVEYPVNPAILQADVVVDATGRVAVVNQGFPPDVREADWGRRAVKARSEVSWEAKGLPSWLKVEPSSGRLMPGGFENHIMFSLQGESAAHLAPGQSHKAPFSIVQANDVDKKLSMEAQLYVHRPPSHFFQLTPGRGPTFMGVVGGPFTGLQTEIEIAKQGGDVRWEVTNLPKWLTLSQTSGDAPNTIRLSINQNGNDLQPGEYSTYLVFRNLTGYQPPVTKIVSLVINRP